MKIDIFLFAAWTIVLTSCGIFHPREHTQHNIETPEINRGIEPYTVDVDSCAAIYSSSERHRVMFDHFLDEWNGRHIPHRWDTIRCGEYALCLQSLLDSVGQRAIERDVHSEDQIVRFYDLMVEPFMYDKNFDGFDLLFFTRQIEHYLYPIKKKSAIDVLFDLLEINKTAEDFGFDISGRDVLDHPFGYRIYLYYVQNYIYMLDEGRELLPYLKEAEWYMVNDELPPKEQYKNGYKNVLRRILQTIEEHNLKEKVLESLDR